MIAFTAQSLLTPSERIINPLVLVEDGVVSEVRARNAGEIPSNARVVDFGDATIAPAYIDLHIHGGAGHDVMRADADGLARFERSLVGHGVGAYFPTTVTAPLDATLAALENLADTIEVASSRETSNRAIPLGIHLEGPFISHARRGVHPPANLVPPTIAIFERFWQVARGRIVIMTIAPELDGALEVIEQATRRGVCVSLGHTDATLEEARARV